MAHGVDPNMPALDQLPNPYLIAKALEAATERLNKSLERLEDKFAAEFGAQARGRIQLRANKDGLIEHLVYDNGEIFYERGYPGKPLQSTHLLSASRDVRVKSAGRLRDLWDACGGYLGQKDLAINSREVAVKSDRFEGHVEKRRTEPKRILRPGSPSGIRK